MEKLDELMCLMFEYLSQVRQRASDEFSDEVFESLLRVFERTILRTHKSRFTQFLLFFFASSKNNYAEAFVRRLVHVRRLLALL